jgi:hypothetical protein
VNQCWAVSAWLELNDPSARICLPEAIQAKNETAAQALETLALVSATGILTLARVLNFGRKGTFENPAFGCHGMPPTKILCVAEKPAIAKAVAQHLGGGRITTVGQDYVCIRLRG